MGTENCIRHQGKIYCYDKEENAVYVYEKKVIEPSQCPDSVLLELIRNKGEKAGGKQR